VKGVCNGHASQLLFSAKLLGAIIWNRFNRGPGACCGEQAIGTIPIKLVSVLATKLEGSNDMTVV
jgi:hypothetical protein